MGAAVAFLFLGFVLSKQTHGNGKFSLLAQGQQDLLDESTSDRSFIRGEQRFGPVDCNARFAATQIKEAFLQFFAESGPNTGPFYSLLNPDANELFFINGLPVQNPLFHVVLLNLQGTVQLKKVSAKVNHTVVFDYDLRINYKSSWWTLYGLRTTFHLDHLCQIDIITNYFRVDPSLPAVVQQLFETAPPQAASPCPPGEAIAATVPGAKHADPNSCVVVSCASPRACPGQPCRTPPATQLAVSGGIDYVCGCPSGFAANNHTLTCLAVSCAARPCPPFATCVDFPASQLDDCNPTPTQSKQWRRGPIPCVRYSCVEMTKN